MKNIDEIMPSDVKTPEVFKAYILDALKTTRSVTVATCSDAFPISEYLIRKALNELAINGSIIKQHMAAGHGTCGYGSSNPRWAYVYFLKR